MNNTGRKIIGSLSAVIDFAVIIFLVIMLIVGFYVLWETNFVHTSASSNNWRAYKPNTVPTYSYDELRNANSDVVGWVDVYGTGIDYPVMYSQEQNYYLFRNPFKERSLIGSIFLDPSTSRDFSDFDSILYGHHMENHCMFGDVASFLNNKFFDEHKYGDLYDGSRHWGLKVIGIINTYDSNPKVYKTKVSRFNGHSFYSGLKDESKFWRDNEFDFSNDSLVLMSTCADSTDYARDVLVCAKTDQIYDDTFVKQPNFGPGVDDLKGWLGFPWIAWFAALVVVVMITIYILWQVNKIKENKRLERMVFNNDKFKI